MAKLPLGIRVHPELKEMIDKEAEDASISKADIVEEMIRQRYDSPSTNGDKNMSKDAAHIDYIQFLKDQIEKKDKTISELEKINQSYVMKVLEI